MLKWVNLCLKPYVAQNPGVSHVIIDDYTSHKVPDVLKAIRSLSCIVSILPGGSTSRIQPLDVGVNKPFKDYLKKYWVKYMLESDNVENGKEITRQKLSFWITESFKEVSDNSIRKTFEKCGYY
jgi:hypothetical protein